MYRVIQTVLMAARKTPRNQKERGRDGTMSIVLIDSTADSLTVSWPEHPDESTYVLQYRTTDDDNDSASSFQVLSESLRQPQVKKRNLKIGTGYFFRARAANHPGDDEASWISHSEPFFCCDATRPDAPQVSLAGTYQTLLVQWASAEQNSNYELQLRENRPGVAWSTIATNLSTTQVRKKNLSSPKGYQFRVGSSLPAATSDSPSTSTTARISWSEPSSVVVPLGLSPAVERYLGGATLLSKSTATTTTQLSLRDAVGGKEFILLYASAHWCGPCRNFTPRLGQWYQQQGHGGATVEVVFVSADHDANGFQEYYYNNMPSKWLAVDFEDDGREELLGRMRVRGIPQLTVVHGRTGMIVEQNAVGQQLDVQRWRNMVTAKTTSS